MQFDREQIHGLKAVGAHERREFHVADIKQRWLGAQPAFTPVVVSVRDPVLTGWIARCYDDCRALGVEPKRHVLRYAFELLRALQLGASREFVEGLREYFCTYRHGSRHALEWINYVVSTLHAQTAARRAIQGGAGG